MRARVLLLGIFLLPGRALAEAPKPMPPTTSSLSWTRGEGADTCITARDLARAVEKKLGRTVFVSAAQADLTVEGTVQRGARKRGWRATISGTRADGTSVGRREIHATEDRCSALNDGVALVVALMIDPQAKLDEPTQAPPAPPPPPPPQPSTVYVQVPVAIAAPRWRFAVAAEGLALLHVLPTLAPAVRLAASAEPPGIWPVEISFATTAVTRREERGYGIRVALNYGALAVCPRLVRANWVDIGACVAAEIGALHASATGLSTPIDAGELWVDVAARLRLDFPFAGPARAHESSGWSLGARVEGGPVVPLRRPRYTYETVDPVALGVVAREIFQVPAVGAQLAAGITLAFE